MGKKKPVGRPPFKIDKAVLKKVKGLAARGLTQDQIAASLGINRDTLYKYKNINQDFTDAISEGNAQGIAEISNSLFTTAKEGNVAAQIFYMKNRAGWADKQDVTMDASITVLDPFNDD